MNLDTHLALITTSVIHSVMSYSKFSDDNIYFEHIDLMMLHAIHHPDVEGRKGVVSSEDYINQFDLNRNKIEEYKDDIVSTCHKKPSEYDFLIDFRLEQMSKNIVKTVVLIVIFFVVI